MYRCESWTRKKADHQIIDAFQLWCCRRLLRVLWSARRSNQSILKEINPECSLEGLMLKLKFQYFGYLMQKKKWSRSVVSNSVTPWTAARQASLSFTVSWSLLKLMSIESVMLCYHLILCRPLLLLPSIFPSIKVFSNESALFMRWPKYWSFSFSISPSNEHSGLISFRIGWFDFLAVQRTRKSLL